MECVQGENKQGEGGKKRVESTAAVWGQTCTVFVDRTEPANREKQTMGGISQSASLPVEGLEREKSDWPERAW